MAIFQSFYPMIFTRSKEKCRMVESGLKSKTTTQKKLYKQQKLERALFYGELVAPPMQFQWLMIRSKTSHSLLLKKKKTKKNKFEFLIFIINE